MPLPPRPVRRLAVTSAVVLAGIVGALLVALVPAEAHTPHDDVSDIALSPSFETDRTIWAISGNRLLRSPDAGITWDARVLGLPRAPEVDKSLSQVAIVEEHPEVMYLTSRIGGLFRSDDAGETWRAVGDSLPTSDLAALAVSPTDPDIVLVGGSTSGGWLTHDGGETWLVASLPFVHDASIDADGNVAVATGPGLAFYDPDEGTLRFEPFDSAVTAVAYAGDTVYAATAEGELHRAGPGASLRPVGQGLPSEPITDLEPDPTGSGAMWAVSATSGVYRSDDGGTTFTPATEGLTTDEQADDVGVSQFRSISAGVGPGGDVQLFTAGFDGVFRSDDGGRRWRAAETLSEYVVGLAVSPVFADDDTIAAVTYVKGAYVSTDGGDTWTALNEGISHDLSAGNKVAQVRRLHNIAFSPTFADDGLLFSATWTTFLRGTVEDGWEEVIVAPPPVEGTQLRQFVMGIAPDFAEEPTIFLGTRQGTVYRSDQAGEAGTWAPVAELGTRVRTLEVAPGTDDDRVLYAGTLDGVRRSADGGATWAATGPDTVALLAMSPAFPDDGTVFAGTEAGLFVTRDDGATWDEALTGAGPGASVEAVAVSPAFADDGTVLVSITGTGLFRSTDGGATFEEVAADLTAANHVIADYTNPTGDPIQFSPTFAEDGTVLAYADRFVLRSTDAGDTWELLELPTLEDFLLATDPSSLDRIVTDVAVPPLPEAGPRRVGVAAAAVVGLLAAAALVATASLTRRRPRTT
jgi:photosystem II stability/assembly factor-like uncharacterized protein